ncbi:hypothetical protein HK097_002222, partial [Rhizophlyctis rosea]
MYADTINTLRQKHNLPPYTSGQTSNDIIMANKIPICYIYSPTLLPKPIDWPEHVTVAGPLEMPEGAHLANDEGLSDEIKELLARAKAEGRGVVYIGFG